MTQRISDDPRLRQARATLDDLRRADAPLSNTHELARAYGRIETCLEMVLEAIGDREAIQDELEGDQPGGGRCPGCGTTSPSWGRLGTSYTRETDTLGYARTPPLPSLGVSDADPGESQLEPPPEDFGGGSRDPGHNCPRQARRPCILAHDNHLHLPKTNYRTPLQQNNDRPPKLREQLWQNHGSASFKP